MDEYHLAQWNNCVDESDTVYILGDLFFRNAVSFASVSSLLEISDGSHKGSVKTFV